MSEQPATDEEISLMWPIYQADTAADGMVRMLFKRIESDAAKHAAALKERDEQIARYEDLLIEIKLALSNTKTFYLPLAEAVADINARRKEAKRGR